MVGGEMTYTPNNTKTVRPTRAAASVLVGVLLGAMLLTACPSSTPVGPKPIGPNPLPSMNSSAEQQVIKVQLINQSAPAGLVQGINHRHCAILQQAGGWGWPRQPEGVNNVV
jgi:hypothetical protein